MTVDSVHIGVGKWLNRQLEFRDEQRMIGSIRDVAPPLGRRPLATSPCEATFGRVISSGSAAEGDIAFLCPFAKDFFGIIVFLERHVVFRNKCAMTYFRQEIEGEAK